MESRLLHDNDGVVNVWRPWAPHVTSTPGHHLIQERPEEPGELRVLVLRMAHRREVYER